MSGFIEIIDTEMNKHLININCIEEVCELEKGSQIFIVNHDPNVEVVCYTVDESYESIKEKLRMASILNCYTKEE